MKKIKLLYVDNDKFYRESLVEYILENFNSKISLISFSQSEMALKYIDDNKSDINLIVVNEKLEEDFVYDDMRVIYLSEERLEGGSYIYKYQSGEDIVLEILDSIDYRQVKLNNATKVYVLYAPYNVNKKEECMENVLRYFKDENKQVFYLNVDPYTNEFNIQNKSIKNLSNLIYDIKDLKDNIKISKYVSEYKYPNIKTINPFNNILEYEIIKKEDLDIIIEKLRESNIYDYIFINMCSGFVDIFKSITNEADKIFFASDSQQRIRSQSILEGIGLNPKYTESAMKVSIVKYDGIIDLIKEDI